MGTPDLAAARQAVDTAADVCTAAAAHLAKASSDGGRISVDLLDRNQVLAYDLAHATSGIEGGRVLLDYATQGEHEARLACLFIAEAIADLAAKLYGRS